ncbi:MAG: hypothetical protein ACKV1O_18270 [Saprospiraceae bacterium]
MRTIHFYLFLSLTAIGIFSCQGCDDDEVPCNDPTNMDCHNYDPCHDRKAPVSADFEVRRVNFDESTSYTSGDTLLAGSIIRFVALDSTLGTTYHWQVGNPQNASTDISYKLSFYCDDVLNQSIPVRLIAERLTDNDCLSEADRRDTVVRVLHFVSRRECLYWGRWEGALDSKPDETFTVELGFSEPFGGECGEWDTIYIKNAVNDGNCLRRSLSHALTYEYALFEDAYHYRFPTDPLFCTPPQGYYDTELKDIDIVVDPTTDSIRLKFKYFSYASGGVTRLEDLVFRGRRVE